MFCSVSRDPLIQVLRLAGICWECCFALNFTNIKHRNFDLISSDWNNLCIFETGSTCKRGADKLCNDITSYPGLLLTKVCKRLLTVDMHAVENINSRQVLCQEFIKPPLTLL